LRNEVSIEPTEEDIENTVAMGGEDWANVDGRFKMLILLSDGATTIAYSYIGPSLPEAVYRKGTIGELKTIWPMSI
jgi:enoyl-[acyl-carrier protein] reductase/trans-2-enoyl-CoA reductase (NAD+)